MEYQINDEDKVPPLEQIEPIEPNEYNEQLNDNDRFLGQVYQLEDMVYSYPDQSDPIIQTLTTGKLEFLELEAKQKESIPKTGTLFKHQEFVKRYILPYDRLLLIHRTGTGKSCAMFGSAEPFKVGMIEGTIDFVTEYMVPLKTNIRHIFILTKGDSLVNELKYQLACKCTKDIYTITEGKARKPISIGKLTKNGKVRVQTEQGYRKRKLSRKINKYYTIKTYGVFAGEIENLTDQQLIERYSDSYFIVDEIQNIKKRDIKVKKSDLILADSEVDGEELPEVVEDKTAHDQRKYYKELYRLFHVIKRSKIMLATATPMTDDIQEFGPIINLLNPEDLQISENIDLTRITATQIEPYVRGKVSYVRELDTGVVANYVGQPLEGLIENTNVEHQNIVYYQPMDADVQQIGYDATLLNPGPYRFRTRQASNFVFPDGSSGESGFNKYVTKIKADEFRAKPELKQYLESPDALRQMSSKYSEIVRICSEEEGNCFCYSDFFSGSGIALLGECFKAQGVVQFLEGSSIFGKKNNEPSKNKVKQTVKEDEKIEICNESLGVEAENREVRIEKRPRFAILTSGMSDARSQVILETFNSYENRYGDYIKVVLGSPVTRIGINLANVLQIHIVGGGWNQSNTYQAISRGIRSTSHYWLLLEQQKILYDQLISNLKETPDEQVKQQLKDQSILEAKVSVNIYQHADSEVDLYLYARSENKDYSIRQLERKLKQISVDCQLNVARNIRDTDVDGTVVCDYNQCNYGCWDPPPNQIDMSSYDVLYSGKVVEMAISIIKKIFLGISSLSMFNLYLLLQDYNQFDNYISFRPVIVIKAVQKIIEQKIKVINKYGKISYLFEENGILTLSQDLELKLEVNNFNSGLGFYNNNLFGIQTISLKDYVANYKKEQEVGVTVQLEQIPIDSPEFMNELNSLSIESKVLILEDVIIRYFLNGETDNQYLVEILNYFQDVYFTLEEPVGLIKYATEAINKVVKLGAPSKNPQLTNTKNLQKILNENFSLIPEVLVNENGETVYVHILYNQSEDQVAFNMLTKLLKVDTRMRILVPSEYQQGGGWRDLTVYEKPIYQYLIVEELSVKVNEFGDQPIYGIYIESTGKFLIKINKNRGKACSNFKIPDLIGVLWHFQLLPPNDIEVSLIESQLKTYLSSRKIENISSFTLDQMQFYFKWLESGHTIGEICEMLRGFFTDSNLLLIL